MRPLQHSPRRGPLDGASVPTAPASPAQPPPAVSARALRRDYTVPGRRAADVHALAGVDLDLHSSSFTAIVGASGCGKSTLLHVIAGLDRPTAGSVTLLGTTTTSLRPSALAAFRAAHVGVVFQEDNLVSSLSAEDNVALPGRLRRRPLPRGRARAALERVGLAAQAGALPERLSGGERQRVAIARVLASRPAIVLADEPTAALDVVSAWIVLDWFAQIASEGACVLMVTHDPAAAARARHVIVMDGGRVVEVLPGGEATGVSRALLRARAAGTDEGRLA